MNQKKSIKLFVVFVILFFAAGIGIGMYSTIFSVSNHLDTFDLPPQSKLIIGIIVLLFFVPILLLTCWYARQEHNTCLLIISLVLLVFISVCVLSEVLPLLQFQRKQILTRRMGLVLLSTRPT